MKLVSNGEHKTQYVVNWELGGEGKSELFDTRAGLFKLVRQLKAVGIPYTVTRTVLTPIGIEGD